MTGRSQTGRAKSGRLTTLAAVVVLQALCAVFFVADVVDDLGQTGIDAHTVFEAFVSLALAVGVAFGAREMRRTLDQARRAEMAVSAAAGAFAELLRTYFDRWALTPAESDVALLAIKGLEIAAIAELRGAAPGTVRAQLTRVYAKAGVSSRSQLVSVFVEDLLAGPIADARAEG